MTNDLILPITARKGYELPTNVEPVFDSITGDFITYAEKAEGPVEDVFIQSDEDITGTPVDVTDTIH